MNCFDDDPVLADFPSVNFLIFLEVDQQGYSYAQIFNLVFLDWGKSGISH
jgi:hypothetical protein